MGEAGLNVQDFPQWHVICSPGTQKQAFRGVLDESTKRNLLKQRAVKSYYRLFTRVAKHEKSKQYSCSQPYYARPRQYRSQQRHTEYLAHGLDKANQNDRQIRNHSS